MKILATCLLVAFVGACGDADDDALADAAIGAPDAAAGCLAVDDNGSPILSMLEGEYAGSAATPDFLSAIGTINDDAKPDALGIELYKGTGAFASGEIVPGTYSIAGAELEYATCGVCVRLVTDWDGSFFSDDGYLATSGTVTVSQVSPKFEGSISNVTLRHVTIDASSFESTPHEDGCTTAITAASWSVTPDPM